MNKIYSPLKRWAFLLLIIIVFSACESSVGTVKVSAYYEMNACGDCAAQFKVTSAVDEKGAPIDYLKDETIHIVSLKGGKETGLDEGIEKCIICYNFSAQGELKKKMNGDYILYADTYSKTMRRACCD